MVNLQTLFGGAEYHSLAADLQLTLGNHRVQSIVGNGHKLILPDENSIIFTDPVHYFILNVGAAVFNVEYLNAITHSYYSIQANAADNSFTAASGGLALAPPGSWITTTGFSNGANNGTFKVTQRNKAGTQVWVAATLVNETVNVTPPVPPATTPLPPVSVSRKIAFQIPVGHCARFMLGLNTVWNFREWYVVSRAYGAAEPFTRMAYNGSTRTSTCGGPTPPPPPPPPPPYDGSNPVDLTSCAATLTVNISGGTGVGAFWNGVYTLTKQSNWYYRYVIDANHWIDIRAYAGGGGYGYLWQVVMTDLTLACPKRFGNNTAGTCPALATYTCFPVAAEGADCSTGGPLAVVVSA